MKLIIDRFEGEYAICEMPNSKMVNIPKIVLDNAKEGDAVVITISDNNDMKAKNRELLDKLLKK